MKRHIDAHNRKVLDEREEPEDVSEREDGLIRVFEILAHLEVQLVEVVISARACSLVIDDASFFKTAALVRPTIRSCLFVNLEAQRDTHAFNDLVGVASTTLRCL